MSEEQSKQIVPAPVLPLVTPEEAAAQWARFEALKSKLLVDDDYQVIQGKRFIKRSGFRKIAVYFGISDRIIKEERQDREDGSFSWRIDVEAVAPNGRSCIGIGACDSRERNFVHLEHDVYATAHTRAKSRAISDMIAGGAVSAEEVSSTDTSEGPAGHDMPRGGEASGQTETPKGVGGEAAGPQKPWEPSVPLTKEPLKDSRVRQFPLIQGQTTIGMLNVLEDGTEASIVPEKPVPSDDPALIGFLFSKVLDAMVEKHSGLEYHVVEEERGILKWILLRGKLDDGQVKELCNAARWAFSKAMERAQP